MSLFDRLVVTTLPLVPKLLVGRVASRYVAGETWADAVAAIRRLNGEGAMATVDLLGEEITEKHQATAALEGYLKAVDDIVDQKLDCNLSVKPTLLGLHLDEDFCLDNARRLVEAAAAKDLFVRLDMEDRHCTDATLRVYRALYDLRTHVGVVFQSYMRRTLADVGALPEDGANVRLCKGIYIEPRSAAWKGYDTVRLNFLAALEQLFRQGVYVGVATHDEYLVCGAVALIDKLSIPRDRYEFQMLLGVEPELRKILLDGGHRLRVYVPFGRDWYLYSIRRLRENPAVAGHVLRALLRGK